MSDPMLRLSAICLSGVAILHLMIAVLSGFTPTALAEALLAVAAGILAAGLLAGWRWIAWVAFWTAVIGVGATAGRLGRAEVPDAVLYGLAGLYGLAALGLFAALWRGRMPDRP